MMTAMTTIVPAAEADLPAVAALAGVIWRACYPGIISPEQIEYMLARSYAPETLRGEIREQGIRYYRLLMGERLGGFASIGPTATPGVMKLHKLYLLPEWQGCGLGSRLLRHCAAEAARLGARRLILAVNKRNDRALAAYRRNGFTVAEAVTVDIGGGYVMDDFIMAKELGAAEEADGQAGESR